MPQLWQRGIALYYAGRYDDCRKQFEAHRTVNPDVVENAAWHFLCVARADSVAAARAALLPVGPDRRVPMHEVYGMTETTAVATGNRPGRIRLGTVGEVHPGTELRIDEETGEILTRSGATFAGYWQREEATRMALTISRKSTAIGWRRAMVSTARSSMVFCRVSMNTSTRGSGGVRAAATRGNVAVSHATYSDQTFSVPRCARARPC